MMTGVEQVLSVQNDLGEGPLWHPVENVLYWVDINRGNIHRYDPASGAHTQFHVEPPVGTMVMRAGGGFALARARTIDAWSPGSSELKTLVTFTHDQIRDRFNDGKADPLGNLWVGTIEDDGKGIFICVKPDLSVTTLRNDVGCANGLAWSPDRRTMYWTDSPKRTIFAYDYDAGSGAISNERIFAQNEGPDVPDGLTIDADGHIWSARWDGWKIAHYAPDGALVEEIPVPAQRVTSCMFGGPDLATLYITSARTGLSAEDLKQQPHAGDLFAVKTGTRGMPEAAFKG
jgi:sugar lactone lactonase YvrE